MDGRIRAGATICRQPVKGMDKCWRHIGQRNDDGRR
jgi:hypothetical protein